MFEHEFYNAKHFDTRSDTRDAYLTFLGHLKLPGKDFPFEVKSQKTYKSKQIIFRITSWGIYNDANGQWRVFIAYYAAAPKHTIQYSWMCDPEGFPEGHPMMYEFIN